MPLIYKPRDATIGQKKVRRKPNNRKQIQATVLPETKAYIRSMSETIPAGRLIDVAIKLYRELIEQGKDDKFL